MTTAGPLARRVASDADQQAAFAVRHAVFVLEQGVPVEEELDARDADAVHVVAVDPRGAVVGTCRVLRDDATTARIGRMAVLAPHRGRGYAQALVALAERQAAADGAERIVLDAQLTAQEFYRRCGYNAHGPVFVDAGIDHISMTKRLA